LISIRRYFTRMNRHGEEFISILDEYEKVKDLPYKDSNIHRFHNLQNRINNLETDTSKNGWKHKLMKMNDDIGNKKREVVVRNIVSNLDKDITNLQNDISALRETKTPDTKLIEQRLLKTLKNSRNLKEKEKRHGRLTRANSFDRIIKTTENLQNNFQDTEVSRKINDLIAQSNKIKTKEDAKKVLTQLNLLSKELNKLGYSKSIILQNDLNEIKKKALTKIPWYYRKFYFGDENIDDFFKHYDKYIKNKNKNNLKTTLLEILKPAPKDAEIVRKINVLKYKSNRIQSIHDARLLLKEVNAMLQKVQKSQLNSKSSSILKDLYEIKKKALQVTVPKDAEISKKIKNLLAQSKKIKTKEEAKNVLTQVKLLSRDVNKSPVHSKNTLIKNDLKEIKQNALKKLPWYRRFYFGDENVDDIVKDYDKYKNQKSINLSFGAVNRIKELRQKIKSIIKKTNDTKFIKRLKNMNRKLKQKLLKRQRLLQQ